MLKRFIVVLLTCIAAITVVASPAMARTRPVTLTITSSTCVDARWVLTLAATSTTTRTVDYSDDTDYGVRIIERSIVLQPNTTYTIQYEPGGSVQNLHGGLFQAGSGGWDGESDPLATIFTYAPHIANPGVYRC